MTIRYFIGIAILTGALILSGVMGQAQDSTYAEFGRQHWEEGMFYLHFLSLPMFLPLYSDIAQQVAVANASPPITLLPAEAGLYASQYGFKMYPPTIRVPVYWIPLIFNVLTQLVCVSGVHRLTAKVSSLTVTLVLAVRKAVSLVLSVVLIGGGTGDRWLWGGSLLVLSGTILYTWSSNASQRTKPIATKSRKQD